VSTFYTLPSPGYEGAQWVVSSLAASAWAMFNNADVCTLTMIVRRTGTSNIRMLLSTSNNNNNLIGIRLRTNTNSAIQCFITDGSGSAVFNQLSASDAFPAGTRTIHFVKNGTAIDVYVDTTLALSDTMSATTATAPRHPLTLGSASNTASLDPYDGEIPELTVHTGVAHNADQRALMRSYLTGRWVAA
jgi:hypothetical protein